MGHTASLIVADGKGNENSLGVSIIDAGKRPSRLNRILFAPKDVLNAAVGVDADIYHLHDPELLPIAGRLKKMGKKVIFDSHEDFPMQLKTKPYLNFFARHLISLMAAYYESQACKKIDAVVAATPHIGRKFESLNSNVFVINNFPIEGELQLEVKEWRDCAEICYVGGIDTIRGIHQLIKSLEALKSNTRLNLVGRFLIPQVGEEVRSYAGWSKVNETGHLDRAGVRDVLGRSFAGVVTFLPAPNHENAQPNKMFEYMSAGVAVIASNFALWREIIEGNNCGICVNPEDPDSITRAINYLADNPEVAKEMGQNGRRAVLEKYNWAHEELKLLAMYQGLSS